jgi:hypothetical protein
VSNQVDLAGMGLDVWATSAGNTAASICRAPSRMIASNSDEPPPPLVVRLAAIVDYLEQGVPSRTDAPMPTVIRLQWASDHPREGAPSTSPTEGYPQVLTIAWTGGSSHQHCCEEEANAGAGRGQNWRLLATKRQLSTLQPAPIHDRLALTAAPMSRASGRRWRLHTAAPAGAIDVDRPLRVARDQQIAHSGRSLSERGSGDNARRLPGTSGIACCLHPTNDGLSHETDRSRRSGHYGPHCVAGRRRTAVSQARLAETTAAISGGQHPPNSCWLSGEASISDLLCEAMHSRPWSNGPCRW